MEIKKNEFLDKNVRYLNEEDIERMELEKLNFSSDDEIDNTTTNNSKNKKKNISIFKSTNFNDFPDLKFIQNENLIQKNEQKKMQPNIEEPKNININELEDIKEYEDLDNEIDLAEQLKNEFEGKEFLNNDKMNEEITDSELLSMPKESIIQYKNYQILKLKALVKTLREEKEILINNYKQTSDNFLNHIKELEYKGTGERPMTAKIIHKISSTSNNDNEKNSEEKEKCPNCGKIIKNNFLEHSLECIRKKYKCVNCNILMNIEDKQKHIDKFKNKDKLYEAIKKKDIEYISQCLKHNFLINDIILDSKSGDYFIHLIIKNNIFNVIKKYENKINVNLENKNKETPLFLAINNNDINVVKELLYQGADIKKRNKGDLSPLMLCCKKNYQNIAELLIKKGANVNEKNILGDTPVKIAQINGNEELALKLINIFKAEIS